MEEKKLELLERASQVYMRLGIRSVTMDDLARELSVSKKTLYKYFNDKTDLVNNIIDLKLQMECVIVENLDNQSHNAIDSFKNISKCFTEHFRNINPTVFYDLGKQYPEAWEKVENHKWNFVRNHILQNIHRGIKEGLFRDDIDPEIVANLYVSATDAMLNIKIFPWPQYKFENVYKEVVDLHIKGLASKKGREYLKQIESNETND